MSITQQRKDVHLLVCCALGVGHYTPAANFVHMLCEREETSDVRLFVSFFAPVRAWEDAASQPLPAFTNLNMLKVPMADVQPIIMIDMLLKCDQLMSSMTELLASSYQRGWPEVSAVIHDPFAVYAQKFTENKALPEFLINPSHLLIWSVFGDPNFLHHLATGTSLYAPPGMKPMRLQMLWEMMAGPPEPLLQSVNAQTLFHRGLGCVSSDIPTLSPELLSQAIRSLPALGDTKPREVYSVSPLCVWQQKRSPAPSPTDRDAAIEWLDLQPERSVLYIALGTLYPMKRADIVSLALAIERTGVRFLWSYKEREASDEGPVMDEEWRDRVKERGLILPWVNQIAVLSHKSLRAFASHCGWNSIVENLTYGGVPMICLPLGSEQHVNSLLVESQWEIGTAALRPSETPAQKSETALPTLEECGGNPMAWIAKLAPFQRRWVFPDSDGFCRLLDNVLYLKYDRFALNASRLQAASLQAIIPGGKSFANLNRLVSDIIRAISQ